jgi:hypothetical protein
MPESRNFTVDGHGGIYKGKSPGQAANKAAKQLFKASPSKTSLSFSLRETTNDSSKKTYTYEATKKKLKEPKIIEKGSVKITITTEYSVKRVYPKK